MQTESARACTASLTRTHLFVLGLFFVTTLGFSKAAFAMTVPTNEAVMDDIFGTINYPADPIDIRFNSQLSLINPDLVEIDDATDWFDLVGTTLSIPTFTIRLYFVEEINWCGSAGSGAVGCASIDDNGVAIELDWTDEPLSGVLYAHEVAHNLGLEHDSGTNNLMRSTIDTDNVNLDSGQKDIIDMSPFVQLDGAQRYIEITPILVSAAAIPLPPSMLLFVGALPLVLRRTQKSS